MTRAGGGLRPGGPGRRRSGGGRRGPPEGVSHPAVDEHYQLGEHFWV